MKSKRVLVSGASIAGPAAAYWLSRYGFEVTVVERAERLREGGQAVDFRGAAHMTMLRKMGLLEEVERRRTDARPLIVLGSDGEEQLRLPASFTGGEIEIARGDLSQLLYDRTRDQAEYVFGDSIASLHQVHSGVEVTLDSGRTGAFDLVLGADGLHSNVRRLVWGAEEQFVKQSGYYVSLFATADRVGLGAQSVLYSEPRRGMLVYGTTEGQLNVMCVFASDALDYHRHDIATQKELVAKAFAGMGWRASGLMPGLADADQFYFDAIGMVQMPEYVKARVALLGDAGYGATTGGMGAGMAMVAAYVLVGELAEVDGHYRGAYAAYQTQIRGYAKACQRVAAGAGPFFAPATAKKLKRRGTTYKLLTTGPMGRLLNRMTTSAANHIKLKDYTA
ncbi:FAD-dependent monooxygenase [Streptomyces sp. NPDC020192]|uniref:FAD-dependent monooxygenase n=1 Tax=Streptomyces sp. NPDC020192 TaxID=3365066 RepID=UPI0037BC6CD6